MGAGCVWHAVMNILLGWSDGIGLLHSCRFYHHNQPLTAMRIRPSAWTTFQRVVHEHRFNGHFASFSMSPRTRGILQCVGII